MNVRDCLVGSTLPRIFAGGARERAPAAASSPKAPAPDLDLRDLRGNVGYAIEKSGERRSMSRHGFQSVLDRLR